jgi:hypothetical protein
VLRLRDTFARFEAVFVARDALFVVPRLREAFARFEAVFVARDAVFAAVRPRALPPPTLARDFDAVVFADVLLRVAAVLETVFLEVAVFFFLACDVFLAGRPRALAPRDLEAVVFDDLPYTTPLSWIGSLPAPGARQQSNRKRGQKARVPVVAAGQHVRGLPDTEPFNLSVPQLRLTRLAFRSQSRPSLTRVGWGRP